MAPNLRISLILNGGGGASKLEISNYQVPDDCVYFPREYLFASAVQIGKPSSIGNVGSVVKF